MVEEQNKTEETQGPPVPQSEKDKFYHNINAYLEQEMQRRGVNLPPAGVIEIPGAKNYDELDEKGKKAVDALMEELKSDIEQKAGELLFAEIRDKIVRSGDIKKLEGYVKKGKKPRVKRKDGCIFIQFGTGDPSDEIHEFLVAST